MNHLQRYPCTYHIDCITPSRKCCCSSETQKYIQSECYSAPHTSVFANYCIWYYHRNITGYCMIIASLICVYIYLSPNLSVFLNLLCLQPSGANTNKNTIDMSRDSCPGCMFVCQPNPWSTTINKTTSCQQQSLGNSARVQLDVNKAGTDYLKTHHKAQQWRLQPLSVCDDQVRANSSTVADPVIR